jgi:hypothetical protein
MAPRSRWPQGARQGGQKGGSTCSFSQVRTHSAAAAAAQLPRSVPTCVLTEAAAEVWVCCAGCASSVLTPAAAAQHSCHTFCVLCVPSAGVLSPQASLLAPASGPRGTGAHSAAAAGAGPARTPYPSAHYSSSLVGTPGSCAGGDDDEDGFVLFTSQSYVRQSQPAISPSFAAGLSAGPEEEPTTTPSQDSRVSERGSWSVGSWAQRSSRVEAVRRSACSRGGSCAGPLRFACAAVHGSMLDLLLQNTHWCTRCCLALTASFVCCAAAVGCLQEPRQSPSHGTTTTGSMAFDLPQPLADEPAAAVLPGPSSTSSQGQDEQEEDLHLQLTCSQLTAPSAAPGAHGTAALAGTGSTTPGDGLGLLLRGGPDLEETTTPELEQIGIVPSQEGGSQHQLLGSGPGAVAVAAAAAGGVGGSRAHAGSTGRGRGGGAPGSSGGRGARGPGVVCEEVTAKQMLFPVFRPLKERKCVILVRHGESSEWRAAACLGSSGYTMGSVWRARSSRPLAASTCLSPPMVARARAPSFNGWGLRRRSPTEVAVTLTCPDRSCACLLLPYNSLQQAGHARQELGRPQDL